MSGARSVLFGLANLNRTQDRINLQRPSQSALIATASELRLRAQPHRMVRTPDACAATPAMTGSFSSDSYIFNRRAIHFEQAVHLQARARFVRGGGSPITGQAHRARSLSRLAVVSFGKTVTATCITNTSGTRVALSPGFRLLVLFLQQQQNCVATPAEPQLTFTTQRHQGGRSTDLGVAQWQVSRRASLLLVVSPCAPVGEEW